MKSVKVLYTRKNYSAFDYHYNQKILHRIYDEDGQFVERKQVEPKRSHYQEVFEIMVADSVPNEAIFQQMIANFNHSSMAGAVTEKIKSGELEVSHSSFSSGDLIQIDDTYYISDGMSLSELNL